MPPGLTHEEFPYEQLTLDDRVLIHNALATTTVKHIVAFEGLFSALNLDLAANTSQWLETTHLQPVPAKFETDENALGVRDLAGGAGPRLFQAIREEHKRQRAFISLAEKRRREGKHLFSLTTHQKIIDVAQYDASWAEATEHDNWSDNNGLSISRGVTTIEAYGMAASEVCQKGGHVFMSFPRTPTIMELVKTFKERQAERLKVDPNAHYIDIDLLINTNNRRMRKEMRDWLSRNPTGRIQKIGRHVSGKYMHIAIEGATTEVEYGDDHKPKRVKLIQAADGLADILRYGDSAPVVLWDQDDPIVEIGKVIEIKDANDIARAQEWQRSTLAKRLNLPDEAVTVEQTLAA